MLLEIEIFNFFVSDHLKTDRPDKPINLHNRPNVYKQLT